MRRTAPLAALLTAALALTACAGDSETVAVPTENADQAVAAEEPTTDPTSTDEPATDRAPATDAPATDEAAPDPSDDPTPTDDAAEQDPTPSPSSNADPTEKPDADGPDTEAPDDAQTVQVFLVRDAEGREFVEPIDIAIPATEAVATAALEELLAHQGEGALRTLVPDGVELRGVMIADGVATVDVSGGIQDANVGSGAELLLAQQLVQTVAQFDTVDAMALLVEGEPVTEVAGHLDWSEPIVPDENAVSPIVIRSPRTGEEVPAGEVEVQGDARVFEANVSLRLYGPDGRVVEETFATASIGAPERGTWSHTLTLDEPGTYTLEAYEQDQSDGEGFPPFVTSVEVTATG